MLQESILAKNFNCFKCNGPMVRKNMSEPFFDCEGSLEEPHPLVRVSSKYDTESGMIPEGPFIDWEQINKKAFKEKATS